MLLIHILFLILAILYLSDGGQGIGMLSYLYFSSSLFYSSITTLIVGGGYCGRTHESEPSAKEDPAEPTSRGEVGNPHGLKHCDLHSKRPILFLLEELSLDIQLEVEQELVGRMGNLGETSNSVEVYFLPFQFLFNP